MTVDYVSSTQFSANTMHFIGDDDDIIEREKELRRPRHKRFEFVAGFNIHQLVKDARKHRNTLHTREGFHLNATATLFDRSPTRSTMRSVTSAKSSKRSISTGVSSGTNSNRSRASSLRICDLLRFDYVHGRNVELSQDRYTASRKQNSFCDGILFGHRPIKIEERIHLKFNKVRRDWRGGIRLGFTTRCPSTISSHLLPSYAVPDLSRTSRFWAVSVPEKYVAKNNVFSIMLQGDGRVIYFINNENKGTFMKGLDSTRPQWPMIDLYGRVIQMTIVDDEIAARGNVSFIDNFNNDNEGHNGADENQNNLQNITYGFHATCGKNIRMDARRTLAKRVDSFWNSLTFTDEPFRPHDLVFIEIAKAVSHYAGTLGVGVTNINPAEITVADLPDNADLLVTQTSQYWVLSRDVETVQGDQLCFEMDENGHMTCSKNGELPKPYMEVDIEKCPLWLVLDVYGSTASIRLMGIIRSFDPSIPPSEQDRRYSLNIDDVGNYEEDTECLMCFKKDRTKNCAIQPCGHITLCHWCAITCIVKRQLRFIVCPICGGPVHDVIKILSRSKRRSSMMQTPLQDDELIGFEN